MKKMWTLVVYKRLKWESVPNRENVFGIINVYLTNSPFSSPSVNFTNILRAAFFKVKISKVNTGGPRYPRPFYSRICLITLKKLVKKAKFLVKMCLFICEFSVCDPKKAERNYLEQRSPPVQKKLRAKLTCAKAGRKMLMKLTPSYNKLR